LLIGLTCGADFASVLLPMTIGNPSSTIKVLMAKVPLRGCKCTWAATGAANEAGMAVGVRWAGESVKSSSFKLFSKLPREESLFFALMAAGIDPGNYILC
jgi:hypothetical protein